MYLFGSDQVASGRREGLQHRPVASITRRRNEIATGEKKYLRAAYPAAREIRISE